MFRSYDHHHAENILIARVTQLTTDPLFYNIANINIMIVHPSCVFTMLDIYIYIYSQRVIHCIINLNVSIEYILYIIIDIISINEDTLSYILLIYFNNGSVE
jgi:hypothetical protein